MINRLLRARPAVKTPRGPRRRTETCCSARPGGAPLPLSFKCLSGDIRRTISVDQADRQGTRDRVRDGLELREENEQRSEFLSEQYIPGHSDPRSPPLRPKAADGHKE